MADLRAKLLDLLDGHLRLAEDLPKEPWWVERARPVGEPGDSAPYLIKYRWDDVPTWLAEASEHPQAERIFEWIAASRSFAPMALRALREEVERHSPSPFVSTLCMACEESEDGYVVPVPLPCPFLLRVATGLGVEREGGA